jgi:hypothetical protein
MSSGTNNLNISEMIIRIKNISKKGEHIKMKNKDKFKLILIETQVTKHKFDKLNYRMCLKKT